VAETEVRESLCEFGYTGDERTNCACAACDLDKRDAALAWMRPAFEYQPKRRYGVSSLQLIRHCVWGDELQRWEGPSDHWDLIGSTLTASEAPEHLRGLADAVIAQYRAWMEPRYVAMADNPKVREEYHRV
jgi:hypothetical protein